MSYEEKRVRVANYGTLPKGSPLLVRVPGTGGKPRALHKLAAAGFASLAAAIRKDLKLELRIASGWRPHRWTSRQQYEQVLEQRFGSVAEGRKWLGFDSPHETGLAMDIGVGGLPPSRATRDKQRQTKLHKWLVEHAWEHGWHPYKMEPWHWEYPLSKRAWETGEPDEAPGEAPAADEDEHVELCEDDVPEDRDDDA